MALNVNLPTRYFKVLVIITAHVVGLSPASGPVYEHLGCYGDQTTSPDLSGSVMVLQQPTAAACAQQCAVSGFPYAGLQAASSCFCGNSYGKYGQGACNMTCNSNNDACGGPSSNDVYYTVDTEASAVRRRGLVVMTSQRSYANARRACVMMDGDLATLSTPQAINNTIRLLNEATSNPSAITNIWMGLSRQSASNTDYAWSYLGVTQLFNMADSLSMWVNDDTYQGDCVSLVTTSGKWQSGSCDATLPYVCMAFASTPYNPDTGDSTDSPNQTTDQSGNVSSSTYVLYVVLSLIMVLFLSSCLAYGIHRLRKGHRKEQAAKNKQLALAKLHASSPSAVTCTDGGKQPDEEFTTLPAITVPSPADASNNNINNNNDSKSSNSNYNNVVLKPKPNVPPLQFKPKGSYPRNTLTAVDESDAPLTARDISPAISIGQSPLVSSQSEALTSNLTPTQPQLQLPNQNSRYGPSNDNVVHNSAPNSNLQNEPRKASLMPNNTNSQLPQIEENKMLQPPPGPAPDRRRSSIFPKGQDQGQGGDMPRRASMIPAKQKKKRIILID